MMLLKVLAATIVDMDFEVHLGLAVKAFEIALELALIGTDGFAETLVVLKYGSKTEREDGGLFEAVGDNSCVIDTGFLIHGICWVMFADDDCQVTGGVEKDLIATNSKYGFKWNWFAMAG